MKNLNQTELLNKTKSLVLEERKITLELLEYLREIERRLLFAEMGFGSLFEFCVKHLGLSEGSAHRRISAMRLSRDVSGVKEKLESGSLNLSNAAKILVAFKKVKTLTKEEKSEIVEECSNKSQSDCDKKLFKLIPEFETIQKSEKERVINSEEVELKVVLSKNLQEKIKKLKDFLAHSNVQSTLELIEHLVDKELKAQEMKRGLTSSAAGQTKTIKSIIWRKAKARCEYSNCTSTYKLEMDHIIPKAMGGLDSPQNLRLLCRAHNIQQAIEKLGKPVMQKYIPKLRP